MKDKHGWRVNACMIKWWDQSNSLYMWLKMPRKHHPTCSWYLTLVCKMAANQSALSPSPPPRSRQCCTRGGDRHSWMDCGCSELSVQNKGSQGMCDYVCGRHLHSCDGNSAWPYALECPRPWWSLPPRVSQLESSFCIWYKAMPQHFETSHFVKFSSAFCIHFLGLQ